MQKIKQKLLPLLLSAGLFFQLHAAAQSTVPISVFGNGADEISNSSYRIIGTLGQPLTGVSDNGVNGVQSGFWYQSIDFITDIEQMQPTEYPNEFRIEQNYPNPFNPETVIPYQLPKASHVNIKIFNMRGQAVKTIVDEVKQAGYYTVRWDGLNNQGQQVASGLYYYVLEIGAFKAARHMMMLK